MGTLTQRGHVEMNEKEACREIQNDSRMINIYHDSVALYGPRWGLLRLAPIRDSGIK